MIYEQTGLDHEAPFSGANSNTPLIGYDNIVTASSIAASDEDADFPAVNLANPTTHSLWKSDSDGSQTLTFSSLSAQTIDYLGLAVHNFGSIAAGLTLAGDTGAGFSTIIPEVFPTDDGPILFRLIPGTYSQLRLTIVPEEYTFPQAAVAYIGQLLLLQRRIYVDHVPLPYGRRPNIVSPVSENGHYQGRIVIGESLESGFVLRNMTPAWYRSTLDPFIVAQQTIPFFFAWRPGTYPEEVGYAWMTNTPQPVNQLPNGMMSIEFQLSGVSMS